MSSVCGLCWIAPERIVATGRCGTGPVARTRLRRRRSPLAVVAVWRMAAPECFIGDVCNRSDLDPSLRWPTPNAPRTSARRSGRPPCPSRLGGGAHRPGNRCAGERGERDLLPRRQALGGTRSTLAWPRWPAGAKPSSSDEPHRSEAAWHGSWHEMASTVVGWWGWWGTRCGHGRR
jgi:hypothetical protein